MRWSVLVRLTCPRRRTWNRAPTRSLCLSHFNVQFSTQPSCERLLVSKCIHATHSQTGTPPTSLVLSALLVKSLQQLSKHRSTSPV